MQKCAKKICCHQLETKIIKKKLEMFKIKILKHTCKQKRNSKNYIKTKTYEKLVVGLFIKNLNIIEILKSNTIN